MTDLTERKPWTGNAEQDKTKMVAIRLPIRLLSEIDKIAKRDKATRASLLRAAVSDFIQRETAPAARQKPVKTELFP